MRILKDNFFLSLYLKILLVLISMKSGIRIQIRNRIKTFWIRHTALKVECHEIFWQHFLY